MNSKPLALIFSTVWPEPESSAAGVRQLQWVRALQTLDYRVVLASPSKLKDGMDFGVELWPLPLNQSWVKEELKKRDPSLIIFDRFILEEQFGHFVYEACPNALVLLETQDLHLIRRARDQVKGEYLKMDEKEMKLYQTDTALRETASLMRVDYGVVISSFEAWLLKAHFGLGPDKVEWIPFEYDEPTIEASFHKSFSERAGFCWVGNFRHAPNVDGLRWFRSSIWPLIRKQLPGAEIYVYGAYPSQEVMEWNQPERGFRVVGQAKNLETVFKNARVNLAPLRFGAGVKGKILEGFRRGLPCVTTKVGAEGLMPLDSRREEFPGVIADDESSFSKACVELYQSEGEWEMLRSLSKKLMESTYGEKPRVQMKNLLENLNQKKASGEFPVWSSRVLRHELMNSHKYFSKWIEAKELKRMSSGPTET